ncbi:phage baseplate assembly protein V [Vibrio fluvialis]|nr:phage baseplate assembly protein V [Vibrio fluvialis]
MNWNQAIFDLTERLEDCERKLRNMIRQGRVLQVEGRTVVINFASETDEDYFSAPMPWIPLYGGEVLEWRAPSLGEGVLVLNLSGGENENHCVALPAIYTEQFQPDDLDQSKTYTSINDVFRLTKDKSGNYLLETAESVRIVTKSFSVEASKDVTITTSDYTRTAETAKTKGLHSQTGNVSISGELDVSLSVKTPAISSYAPGAFSMSSSGAILASARINNIEFIQHVHDVNQEYQPTETPKQG